MAALSVGADGGETDDTVGSRPDGGRAAKPLPPVQSLGERGRNRLASKGDGQQRTRCPLERIQAVRVPEVPQSSSPATRLEVDERERGVGIPVLGRAVERPAKGRARPLAIAHAPRENSGDDVGPPAEHVEPTSALESVECSGGILLPAPDCSLDVPRRKPGQCKRDRSCDETCDGDGA